MDKFSSNFKFEDTYKKLSTVSLVDPQTVIISGSYYSMNKPSAKTINSSLGMRSLQFSNQLFDHDNDLWKTLRDKKSSDSTINEFKDSHYAMIIDDMVVSIIDKDSYMSDLMKVIESYTKKDNLQFFYNYKEDEFQFIVLKEVNDTKVGFIIRYFIPHNWITVNNVLYDKDNVIYFSSESITDKEVEDDIEMILDESVLLSTCDIIIDEYSRFIKRSSESKISFDELFNYLKYDFKIKIKYTRIDPIDYLANHNDLSTEVSKFINDVLTYIYDTDAYHSVNAPWLRKSIQFSKYSFYQYYKILSSMYIDDQVSANSLFNIIHKVMNNETNFIQIKD